MLNTPLFNCAETFTVEPWKHIERFLSPSADRQTYLRTRIRTTEQTNNNILYSHMNFNHFSFIHSILFEFISQRIHIRWCYLVVPTYISWSVVMFQWPNSTALLLLNAEQKVSIITLTRVSSVDRGRHGWKERRIGGRKKMAGFDLHHWPGMAERLKLKVLFRSFSWNSSQFQSDRFDD